DRDVPGRRRARGEEGAEKVAAPGVLRIVLVHRPGGVGELGGDGPGRPQQQRGGEECKGRRAENANGRRHRAPPSAPSRYTRRAVPLNSSRFSSALAPDAVSLSAFHSAAQPIPILSTGKLLS